MPVNAAKPGRSRLAVVGCMDARIDLVSMGADQTPDLLITNAGGLVAGDVQSDLAHARHALGIDEIRVVMHTDCQLHGLDDDSFLASIEAETGHRPSWSPGGFESLETELRAGIGRLRDEPLLSGVALRGFILDVTTRQLEEVGFAG